MRKNFSLHRMGPFEWKVPPRVAIGGVSPPRGAPMVTPIVHHVFYIPELSQQQAPNRLALDLDDL